MNSFEGVAIPKKEDISIENEGLDPVVNEYELAPIGIEDLKVLEGFDARIQEFYINSGEEDIAKFSTEFTDFSSQQEGLGVNTEEILLDHFMIGAPIENPVISKFDTEDGAYAKYIDELLSKYGV